MKTLESYYKIKSETPPSCIKKNKNCDKRIKVDIDLENLPIDPGLRTHISKYDPNIRDEVRRAYIQRGLCQPRNHKYPLQQFENQSRKLMCQDIINAMDLVKVCKQRQQTMRDNGWDSFFDQVSAFLWKT